MSLIIILCLNRHFGRKDQEKTGIVELEMPCFVGKDQSRFT